jgi:hypothetical protein
MVLECSEYAQSMCNTREVTTDFKASLGEGEACMKGEQIVGTLHLRKWRTVVVCGKEPISS